MLWPKSRISIGVRKFKFSTHHSETSIIKFARIFGVADGNEKTKRKRQEMKNVDNKVIVASGRPKLSPCAQLHTSLRRQQCILICFFVLVFISFLTQIYYWLNPNVDDVFPHFSLSSDPSP